MLELRVRGQLIHCLRKRKATGAYSRLEDLAKASPPDDTSNNVTPSHRPGVTTSRGEAPAPAPAGPAIVNGIRISDAEIEALRQRGYEGELVEALETFLSDLLL